MQVGGAPLAGGQHPFSDWTRHQQQHLRGVECAGAGGDEERWPLFISPYGGFTCVGAVGDQIMLGEARGIPGNDVSTATAETCGFEALDAGESSGNCCCPMSWLPRERLLVASRVVIDMGSFTGG